MPFTEFTSKPPSAATAPRGFQRVRSLFGNPRVAMLAGALIFGAAVLIAVEFAIREEVRTGMRNAERQTETLALALRDRFASDLKTAETAMRLLLRDLPSAPKPADSAHNPSPVSGPWDRYAVFDMDGAVLFRGAAFAMPQQQVMEHLRQHAQGGEPVRIGGSRQDVSGAWVVDVSLRAAKASGTTAGFALGSIDLETYRRSQAEMRLGSGILEIITRDGRIVSRISGKEVSSGQETGGDAGIRAALEAREGCRTGVMTSPLDGRQRISSYCPLAAYPLVAAAGTSRDAALAASDTIALRYRQVAGVLLALLAAGTAFILQGIRRQELTQQALQNSESRFRALNALGSDWYWECDAQYRYTGVSEGLSRLCGRPESDFAGRSPWDLPFCAPAGADWAQHKAVIARCEAFRDFNLRYLGPRGDVAYASISGEPVFAPGGRLTGYRGVGNDVTIEMVLRQRLRMQHDVTRTLSGAGDVDAAMSGVIRTICRTMEWGWGAHRHIDPQTMMLTCPRYWLAPGINAASFVEFALQPKPADPGNGTVSRAIVRNEIVWFTDHTEFSLRRSKCAHDAGLRGAIAVPVPRSRGVEDALEFFSARVEAPDQIMLDTLEAIGREVGQFLDRAEAQQTSVSLERERRHLVEMLQLQLQHMPIACLIQDRDFRIIYSNPAAERTFGYASAEMHGRDTADFLVPASGRALLEERRDRVRAGDMDVAGTNENVMKDGRTLVCRWSITPLTDDRGAFSGALAVAQDVSEQVKMIAALEQSEERYRQIFAAAPLPMWVAGVPVPHLLAVNEATVRTYGYAREELLRMTSIDLQVPEDRDRVAAELGAVDTRLPSRFDRRHQTRDGQVILAEVYAQPFQFGDRAARLIVVNNVTEQKHAQQALEESEARFRAFFEQASVGMAVREVSLKPRFLRVNRKLCEILGYDESELLQLTSLDVTPEEDRAETQEYNVRLRAASLHSYSRQKRYRRKDGRIIWVELSVAAVEGVDGKPQYLVSVIQDITEQINAAHLLRESAEEIRKLNAELERRVEQRTRALAAANRDLESFSYSVSHDLRAPLRTIDGFSQILLQEYAGSLDEAGRGYLERVRAGSQRMARLIDDLLELARVTRRDLNIRACDLTSMAREIAQDLQRAEPERSVKFIVAEGMTVTADPGLMRIAMDNLIRNAWKFTGQREQAVVEVGSITGEGETTYFVRDNGVGFDMAYAGKLFGPFQRLHSEAEFQGTGIGLALVQRVIRRHGGEVRAEAEPDRGATFFIALPQHGATRMNDDGLPRVRAAT